MVTGSAKIAVIKQQQHFATWRHTRYSGLKIVADEEVRIDSLSLESHGIDGESLNSVNSNNKCKEEESDILLSI